MSHRSHKVRWVALSGSVLAGAAGVTACLYPSFFMSGVSAATTDAEKREVRASQTAVVDGHEANVQFTTILRSGETVGAGTFGQVVDDTGTPLLTADGSSPIADSNDFSSLLPVGHKLFSVAQFESRPGAVYLTELSQDPATGALAAVDTKPLDLSGIGGIWNPCAGMVTPWNSHLGSEEYEPDAKGGSGAAAVMAPFFGGGTVLGGDPSQTKPYRYGFPVEVTVRNAKGDYRVARHYSMGRMAHELSYVMPDSRTVYQSDDGTNVGLFLYVADQPQKLSSGSLYAMKWTQTSGSGQSDLGTADVSWIKLGHATDDEVEAIIDRGIAFDDIFDSTSPVDGVCPDGFASVNANGVGLECLAVRGGQEKAAAFLETRRYAGILGATTELRKEEGITFDEKNKRLYVAFSELQYGMEDNKKNNKPSTNYDIGTSNDVRLLYNTCGAVYGFDVVHNRTIGSRYVLSSATGVLAGRMTTLVDADKANPRTIDAYDEASPFAGSTCDIDGIANPDNVSFVQGRDTLLIGEDTGDGHQNDAVWSYNLEDKSLTRIATTPYGAETTSLYHYPDIGGFGYIVLVVQHPYGESDQAELNDPAEARSYFGVIGALPGSSPVGKH